MKNGYIASDVINSSNLKELINEAIEILKEYEPEEGYYVCFSGGKDSQVIYDLVKKSGVKHDVHFNFTTIEFPETIQYIKTYYPEVIWDKPEKTMYQIIEQQRTFPTRLARFCCRILKEHGGENRLKITGVRKQESNARSKRNKFEFDRNNPETKMIHIILDWTEKEVWQYIKENIGHWNPLYDKGFKRVGCVGCPMVYWKTRIKHFEEYPNYKKAYINSMQKGLNIKPNKHFGKNAEMFFDWWISGLSVKNYIDNK